MTMQRDSEATLGGIPIRLVPAGDRPPLTAETVPPDPEDTVPFREHLPFGASGMGSSLRALRDGYDYSFGIDVEEWDQIGPGLLQSKVGLALDNPVTRLASATATGATTGPNAPGTATADAGTDAWLNPTNAIASDNVYATTAPAATSPNLVLTNFGLAVPTGATILGVYASVEVKSSSASAGPVLKAQLIVGGVVQTVQTKSAAITSTTDYEQILGGSADTWGLTITPAQANASTFGVALFVQKGDGVATVSVDRVRLAVVYGTSARVLYAAAKHVLTKLSFDTSSGAAAFATLETKTFTHGDATGEPAITDVFVAKDGQSPGDAMVLVGFGGEAQLQQIDAIAATGADTYRALSALKAYAGRLGAALGTNNTERLVWKSTGSSGQNTGPFSRLQSSAISASTKDFTSSANWNPATPYQAGDYGTDVTALAEFQRGLLVGKPEGVYAHDENANAYLMFGTRAYAHPDNAKAMTAWQDGLLIPTARDLMEFPGRGDAAIGLSTLLSNLSPVTGYPTALAHHGRDVYVAFYDGTDSYVVKGKRRTYEEAPTSMLWFPLFKVASLKVEALHVAADGTGAVFLFHSTTSATAGKYDVGYTVFWPDSKRRYAASGEWYAARGGSPEKLSSIERFTLYGVSLGATATYTVSVAWDEGAQSSAGLTGSGVVNANGRQTVRTTAGTNDSGYVYQPKLTLANATSTNRPRLRAQTAAPSGEGGIIVEGQRQADAVEAITLHVAIAEREETGRGGRRGRETATRYEALEALQGTYAALVLERHWGDRAARTVYVRAVTKAEARKDAGHPPQLVARVDVRRRIGDSG